MPADAKRCSVCGDSMAKYAQDRPYGDEACGAYCAGRLKGRREREAQPMNQAAWDMAVLAWGRTQEEVTMQSTMTAFVGEPWEAGTAYHLAVSAALARLPREEFEDRCTGTHRLYVRRASPMPGKTCAVSWCTRSAGHDPPCRNGFTGEESEVSDAVCHAAIIHEGEPRRCDLAFGHDRHGSGDVNGVRVTWAPEASERYPGLEDAAPSSGETDRTPLSDVKAAYRALHVEVAVLREVAKAARPVYASFERESRMRGLMIEDVRAMHALAKALDALPKEETKFTCDTKEKKPC